MSIEKKLWGSHNGKDCYLFTLENGNMKAEITNYAGSLVKLIVPDKDCDKGDVLLGYDTLDGYVAGTSSQGALVGRYANRIGGAKFLTARSIPLRKMTTATRSTAVISASIRKYGKLRITAMTALLMLCSHTLALTEKRASRAL